MTSLSTHNGHSGGLCDLAFTKDGSSLITCGADQFVHVFDSKSMKKLRSMPEGHHEDEVNTLALCNDSAMLATGSGHFLKLFQYPSFKFESMLTRCTQAINSIAFAPNKNYVACASGDNEIRVVSLLDTNQMKLVSGHDDAVLSLAWDPRGEYLASSSADGTLRIWNVADWQCVLTQRGLPVESSNPMQRSRIAWSKDGSFLAIPSKMSDVRVMERDDWSSGYSLSNGHAHGFVDCIAWSPNGLYICTAGLGDNQVLLWDCEQRDSIGKYRSDAQVCGIAWNPCENSFATIDVEGQFSVVSEPIPSHMPAPFGLAKGQTAGEAKKAAALAAEKKKAEQEAAKKAKESATPSAAGRAKLDDLDDEEEDAIIPSARKRKRLRRSGVDTSVASLKEEYGLDNDASDSEFESADEAEAAAAAAAEGFHRARDEDGMEVVKERPRRRRGPVGPVPQPPIQSGSTPVREQRRFLCWNSVGSIISRDEGAFSALEFDFSDRTKHRPLRMTDHYNFDCAALGDRGAILSCRSTKSDLKGEKVLSTIFYKPFQAWSHNSDWIVQLHDGEESECLAIGDKFAAVATSHGFIRIFRHSGVQDSLYTAPGPVVAMSGRGKWLIVVYHAGAPFAGRQNLAYDLYDMNKRKKEATGPLHLRPGVTLDWLDFSDTHLPCAADSDGLVMALVPSLGWQWSPIIDTGIKAREAKAKVKARAESRGDHAMDVAAAVLAKAMAQPKHWIIGIARGRLMCVLCRGEDKFPATMPKPVPTAVDLKMPLLGTATQSGTVEESWMRRTMLLGQRERFYASGGAALAGDEAEQEAAAAKEAAAIDRNSLQLIQIACKNDRLVRALDVATRLRNPNAFAVAVQLTQKLRQPALAERINLFMRAKAANGWKGDGCDDIDEDSSEDSDGEGADIFDRRRRGRNRKKSSSKRKKRRGKKKNADDDEIDDRRKGGAKAYAGEAEEEEFDFSSKNPLEERRDNDAAARRRRRLALRRATRKKKEKKSGGDLEDEEEDEEAALARAVAEEEEEEDDGSSSESDDDGDEKMDEDSDEAEFNDDDEENDKESEEEETSGRKSSSRKAKSKAKASIDFRTNMKKIAKRTAKKKKKENRSKGNDSGGEVKSKKRKAIGMDDEPREKVKATNPFKLAARSGKSPKKKQRVELSDLVDNTPRKKNGQPKLARHSSFSTKARNS
eukprot:g1830.t1